MGKLNGKAVKMSFEEKKSAVGLKMYDSEKSFGHQVSVCPCSSVIYKYRFITIQRPTSLKQLSQSKLIFSSPEPKAHKVNL